jgi:hypothetical protein
MGKSTHIGSFKSYLSFAKGIEVQCIDDNES